MMLRKLLCWFSLCQTFRTESDNTGVWGECTICGKRVGFVDRATLRAFADAEILKEKLRRSIDLGFDGYCTDCNSATHLHNGRCGCGSGRVVTPLSLQRARKP